MNLGGSGIPVFKMKLAETGKIRDIKKIIARVEGLPSCLNGQLVDLGEDVRGIVMGFDEEDVRVLVLGDENKLRIGREVTGVSEPFTIPVGEGCLGRMLNALGEPVDNGLPIAVADRRPVRRESPTITDRAPVDEFLHVGTKIVDAFVPIAKGQRQLIIGDRMTGKTVVASDAIISQKGKGVVCIYCCIGKSMSALEKTVATLQAERALDYTVIMIALDNAPVGEQYLVPYAAASMADHFSEQGGDVLVVFDDLTKHAWAYRQLSLLLERPPGREAYPGDIFYVHTQLMERAGKLSEERGGGSTTFLAIAETLEGDLTGYIPSNLISMCDGLVFLSNSLFGEGIRPAIDFSLSVSIVGGKAQPEAMRALSTELRVQYAQYSEIAKLSKLQTALSAEAEGMMRRGDALVSVLQQGQYAPVSIAEEVFLLYAVASGALDNIGNADRKAFTQNGFKFACDKNPGLLDIIGEGAELTENTKKQIDKLLAEYFSTHAATETKSQDEEQETGDESEDS
jgi:F-type H+-transporting ATPase subunit alpha